MSYEPTNWKTGDVVTSSKLNKLENGVANAGGGGNLILHETVTKDGNFTISTLDKTWKEISDVFMAGGEVYIMDSVTHTDTDTSAEVFYSRRAAFNIYTVEGEGYGVNFEPKSNEAPKSYFTDSENGYPSHRATK